MKNKELTGVLLVNLGTPLSPSPKDVRHYLIEFLTDSRVIDIPWLSRQLLVRGMIVPKRYKKSAEQYKKIWTEEGSPLLVHSQHFAKKLQDKLGQSYKIALAMRYQEPSIEKGLKLLRYANVKKLLLFPLFPQYASATTGSIFEKVFSLLKTWPTIPQLTTISHFATDPAFIRAFASRAETLDQDNFDHVLFSFHGLPQRQLKKADRNHHCLQTPTCCQKLSSQNNHCYSAQCYATAEAIAKQLSLPREKFSISFQSRLGKEPWLTPQTDQTLQELAKSGKKQVLIFSPSFVCDCLETTFEIGEECQHLFQEAGGKKLTLVPGLNDSPLWVEAAANIIKNN